MVKCIAWNIRAGGGVRCDRIADYLVNHGADVIALSEFRGTPPSKAIAAALAGNGFVFQQTTAKAEHPAGNALLVASRWPLQRVKLKYAPDNEYRWLVVTVNAPQPFCVIALHIPNRATGVKYVFQQSVVNVLRHWRGLPALVMGDTNSGKISIDEETRTFNRKEHEWLESIESLGWIDAFRLGNPHGREYTWYSPNGRNGFRLDQVFMHPLLAEQLTGFRHEWAGQSSERREELSDHAALIVEYGD